MENEYLKQLAEVALNAIKSCVENETLNVSILTAGTMNHEQNDLRLAELIAAKIKIETAIKELLK